MKPSTKVVCGIDEAGRGPWAGPVCAAAVVLGPDIDRTGLTDSKKLTAKRRDALAERIKEEALVWSIGWASAKEIDELNIRKANHLAMVRAYQGLNLTTDADDIVIDGNDCPDDLKDKARTLVGGDALVAEISAASILAKTARDALMEEAEGAYPGYGFAKHKGYGVKAHKEALDKLGPCDLHRLSFKPVQAAMDAKAKVA